MMTTVRPLLFAWQFLTAVPLSRNHHEPSSGELAGSMTWYPFVGFLLGGVLAVLDLAMRPVLPHEVTAVVLIVLLVGMTRGLHQDGLADTFDGLAGGRTPPDRLAIMRDPRIGAIGATALVLSLLLRYSALASMPDSIRSPVLLCMPAVGRWAMVVGAYGASYARPEGGLAAPFLTHLSIRHLVGATVILGIVPMGAFGVIPTVTMVVTVWCVSRLLTRAYRHFFGGITGDTLGATNELVELSFLLLIPIISQWS